MRSTGGGAIVNNTSAAGVVTTDINHLYWMSKRAVTRLLKTAARQGGKLGIRVNENAPAHDGDGQGLLRRTKRCTFGERHRTIGTRPRRSAGRCHRGSDVSVLCTGVVHYGSDPADRRRLRPVQCQVLLAAPATDGNDQFGRDNLQSLVEGVRGTSDATAAKGKASVNPIT